MACCLPCLCCLPTQHCAGGVGDCLQDHLCQGDCQQVHLCQGDCQQVHLCQEDCLQVRLCQEDCLQDHLCQGDCQQVHLCQGDCQQVRLCQGDCQQDHLCQGDRREDCHQGDHVELSGEHLWLTGRDTIRSPAPCCSLSPVPTESWPQWGLGTAATESPFLRSQQQACPAPACSVHLTEKKHLGGI
uniref:Uncharacterized protein n=1 Tax=Cyanistes caeruleus TaxID=156563 RepID=A0A8C0U7C9_CYACU